jgi:acetyltransferase-like isoleucine patch superfamily enzyme
MMKFVRFVIRDIYNLIKFWGKKIIVESGVATSGSIFEGNNKIGCNTIFTNSRIGYGSYIGPNCHFNNAKIGRYCSMGQNIKVISGTHPAKDYVSTHPAFFSLSKQAGFTYVKDQKFNELLTLTNQPDITVLIGNDVWIGDDVTILGGIEIGDGAIIGSKSLVVKNVDNYAIVGGVPAKKIRSRFNEEDISFLLNFKWWNKSEKWISENAPLFNDIIEFKKKLV